MLAHLARKSNKKIIFGYNIMQKELKAITADVKANTATTYTNNYKRLREVLEITSNRKSVKSAGLNKIEPILLDDTINSNARAGMLTVVKKLFSTAKDKERVNEIDMQIRQHRREHQIKKNGELTETLPSYKQMITALKKVQDPRQYLINFIFIFANSRNADVALIDVHRSNDTRVVDVNSLNKERNHIVLQNGHALLVRNVYKTAKSYGQKRNKITSRMFVDMAREYLGDDMDKPLLTTKLGNAINPSSFGAYLKKYRLMELTESQIMKIVMRNVAERGNYNLLRKVSENRGTSIETLLTEYDISNIKEPSTELKGSE